VILDNDDDLDKVPAGGRPKTLLVKSIPGVLNWTRVCITPFQPQNSPQNRQSPLIHLVHGMTLRRAAMLRRQPGDLGLTSSTACFLLPHKPNHCKIRPTSKLSAVSLEARQWSLGSISSPSLPTAAMMNGQMRTWLYWRKNWYWLWESNKWSHHRPAHLPPQVLARLRRRRTRSRVENAAKSLVVDQKSCEILVDLETSSGP
jgi:hypothetical protein